ncbi:hypothetical protein ACHAXN_007684 [Cyclotella atomus]
MPKETLIPIQYPQSQSPHRRHHYPVQHHPQPPRQPSQQPPPSTAAAKAAAAAKALHRRALDRAQQKQSQPPPHAQPRHDPRWEQHQQQHEAERNDDRRRSAMGVFRRTDEEDRFRMESGYSRPPPHNGQPHPSSNSGRREEYNYEKEGGGSGPPPYPQMPPGYPWPYNYPYMPPHAAVGAPPNYPEEEDKNSKGPPPNGNVPPGGVNRQEQYPRYSYDPRYYDPNFANNGYPPPFYSYPYPPPADPKNGGPPSAVAAAPHPGAPPNHPLAPSGPPPNYSPPTMAPHVPPHEEKRVKYQESEPQPSRSTRRIIGSHTPIHVPRAEDSPLPFRYTNGKNAAASSVFRSQEPSRSPDTIAAKEMNAHEILLSLSKSFDKRENNSESRPKSPEEPPRLKHFHKERGDGFEPQPSPLRPDKSENDIEFAPSFALFNQSFDMNLESLLGPNASFGLGPMKSLSFGLGGLGGSIDYCDPRISPVNIHRVASRVNGEKDKKENVQVLRASPSNSFGNVLRAASSNGSERKKGVMVLGDSVRVASPSALEKKRSRSPEKNTVLDGNARNLPFRLKDDVQEKESDDLDILEPPKKKKATTHTKSFKMDLSFFKIIENHQSAFGAFTFLLPGARTVLSKKLDQSQSEMARRRINSALCAFGGLALPKQVRGKKSATQQKYEQMLPERYYEDDNRLSWEVEEDPPVEISEDEASTTAPKGKLSTCDSADFSAMSLQRNMGIMVYPALNAYVAAEPGVITPALVEMNNFVNSGKKSPECTPAKGDITTLPPVTTNAKLPMVSPDCVKLGSDSSTPDDKNTSVNHSGGVAMSLQQSKGQSISKTEMTVPDHLFIDAQELAPEQYRVISDKKHESYEYPSLPVPYAQRKRMSNAVFAMSKSIPGLTDECAAVLSEARKKDAWDFAVAELMTQVVVLTHCEENDWELDGLSKYLLTLGIAC